ncbi:nicotinate phosphoribosyltransferase [Coniophora puteana RWD-64-598 SS2]|uniref:Nicotinate phosphoribosyltransferase n=1 Tax=Coniophora puteana (strain RWD-64-598) TaxID=741705 RepID=A0A5M3MZT2_CONPW|nr:nicotinate phosphoribosyltransferase [Coniophora puteana RWD-64-598 SS2]EIW84141.1 nicotinate phosphoribosyltransferase [Coniophora puteana RWD-64-598 SS2]
MSDSLSPAFTLRSLLDTDLYKFTMQQAVLRHFPDVECVYRFTHRDPDIYFPRRTADEFRNAIARFSDVSLSQEELQWLKKTCAYFHDDYLDYLAKYRFKPEQVTIGFVPKDPGSDEGKVTIEAKGLWVETILWEVPLMACLSELYFRTCDTDWNYDGQAGNTEQAYEKGRSLLMAGCVFNEFGTRRRRSLQTQDIVVDYLVRASRDFAESSRGRLNGTSNVYLARKHGINPSGTIAHEWFMGVAAIKGYEHASSYALDLWEAVYPKDLLVTLTDTFSTEDFILDKARAQRWRGLRQDSGDPFVFAPRAKEIYESLGIDHREKTIIFSDALNVEKALRLKQQCDELGFTCAFGVGTDFSNDFRTLSSGGKEKSKALNMVIKLGAVGGKECVKISDELTKNTGDKATVAEVKRIYDIRT